jgi:hypothetical protein
VRTDNPGHVANTFGGRARKCSPLGCPRLPRNRIKQIQDIAHEVRK